MTGMITITTPRLTEADGAMALVFIVFFAAVAGIHTPKFPDRQPAFTIHPVTDTTASASALYSHQF